MDRSSNGILKLLEQIARTQERELDCGEVFAILDEYTESIVAGEDVSEQFALVIQHLDLCQDCLEEYQSLLSVLQTKH